MYFVWFFAGAVWLIAVAFIFEWLVRLIHQGRVRRAEYDIIQEFCKKYNYCRFGCGGGRSHDNNQYYGGYNCGSDHK